MQDRDESASAALANSLPATPAEPPLVSGATPDAHPAYGTSTAGASRRNFVLLLVQGSSYGLAGRLASTNIVLPFLCAALGGSLVVAGLLVPLGTLGTLIGYVFAPKVLATRLRSRTVMAVTATASALFLFALSTVSLLLPDRGAAINLTFLGVALGMGVTTGIGSIAFTDVLARGIPRQRRSTLLLTQAAVGGVMASVVAVASVWLFSSRDPIVGHIALEWFAGGFLLVAAACVLLVGVEHVPMPADHHRPSIGAIVRDGIAAARRYPWLRAYLLRQILFLSVSLATTFFSIRVATLHGSVPGSLAVIIAVTSFALVAGALLWGRTLRWGGYRGMLVAGTLCSTLAAAGAVLVERIGLVGSPVTHAALMLLATLAADAVAVSKSAFLAENAPAAELPTLSAFSQLTIGLASAFLAAGIAALAEMHGTVWPPFVLLLLNVVAVVAAWRSSYGSRPADA